MHAIPHTLESTETECGYRSVRRVESPMIAELCAAMHHVEHLVETVGTPEEEAAAYTQDGFTPEQHRSWVLGNADRLRRALDTLTAPYATPPTDAVNAPALKNNAA